MDTRAIILPQNNKESGLEISDEIGKPANQMPETLRTEFSESLKEKSHQHSEVII